MCLLSRSRRRLERNVSCSWHKSLGIRSPLADNLSIALGTSGVSLLEITAAFGALAYEGVFVAPTAAQAVMTPEGDPAWRHTPERHQSVSPQARLS